MTRWQERAALVAIVLLGAILRCGSLGLTHYNIDEAIASSLATQIVRGVTFPLVGIRTSFGFHNPPWFLYLLAPFFAISRDPRLAQLFLALLGSCVPVILWRATKLAGGGGYAAMCAAFVVALCPNAIEHSRRLWGHDTIVFLGSLSLWLSMEGYRRRDWRLLSAGMSAAAVAQTMHLSGALLWLTPIILSCGVEKRSRAKAVAMGLGVLLCLYIPWIINEIRGDFADLKIVIGTLFGESAGHDLGLAVSPAAAWALILGDSWNNDLLGNRLPWMVSRFAAAGETIVSTMALAILAGGISLAARNVYTRPRESTVEAAILAGIVAPFIAFAVLFRASVAPYFLPALPCAVVAGAFFLEKGTVKFPQMKWPAPILYGLGALLLVMAVRADLRQGGASRAPLSEKMEVVGLIDKGSARTTPYVFQNDWGVGTGIDIAYVYLLYWREVSDRIPSDPREVSLGFVILEDHAALRPEVKSFLRARPHLEFPHQTLYRLRGADVGAWIAIVERYPAPPNPEV